ncbi:MAG: sugar transferase [Prevotella sp.]|uniref:sugar transferase n=1 Tax=Prevotella sp. PTAC TaxID=2736295 RepID=UPI001557907F|nr:sugar transferase [Prevotella sp. PTAC]MCX4293158.1 sugar transferase [Prevotella sp.]NPD54157.1 sugar transferase [Prevotella sp. PTAC]
MTIIKRFFDIVCSLIGIIFFIPAYIVIYIILKITSRGPAIFKQERIGKGGKPFDIYKFRTMVPNTEEDGIPLLAEVNDERLTTFGKYLREHHIDELPQLWNVLKGDMSFVGYRPERKYFIDKIMTQRPDYAELYRMRPGITSMATLYNGYTNTMEKMIRRLDMDLDYLNNFSLLLDMKIVANTFLSVIAGKKF